MTLYLDTSDLVKLYIDEPGASAIRTLVQQADVVVTSALAYPEARATFARRRRERLLTTAELKAIVRQFDIDWERLVAIALGEDHARRAGRLADEHGIRGADAVHLAAFEQVVAGCTDADVRFLSSDEALSRAARELSVS